jgi:hypothetical protein
MTRADHVIATCRIRLAATRELEATGPDYASARDALLAEIPEDHRLTCSSGETQCCVPMIRSARIACR